LEINLVEKNPPSSLYVSITEHEAYVLDRSDILDIGNRNIVLYRIEFMPTIHRPKDERVKNFDTNKHKCPIRGKFQRWPSSSKPKVKISKFTAPI
jgi:hypothetical protein